VSSYPGILPAWIDFGVDQPHPEPLSFHAGDSLQWERDFEKYPASAGWTLQYVLNNQANRIVVSSGDITTGNGSDEGSSDGFFISIPNTETLGWAPGNYLWLAVLTNSGLGQRFTGAAGRVQILADILDASAPVDTRSQTEIALENVKAMLAGRANDGVQEYKIGDRELRRYSMSELLKLKSYYEAEVKRERQKRGEYEEPDTVAFHAGWGING